LTINQNANSTSSTGVFPIRWESVPIGQQPIAFVVAAIYLEFADVQIGTVAVKLHFTFTWLPEMTALCHASIPCRSMDGLGLTAFADYPLQTSRNHYLS
jgi:hypothetical protein